MAEGTVVNGGGCADCFTPIIMNTVAELRRDVAKSEADIKAFEAHEFCDLGKTVLNDGSITRLNLANAERDLQNRIHETRVEALKTNTELSRYLADKSEQIKERLTNFERSVDDKFCGIKTEIKDSERRILDKLTSETIDSLRHEKYADRHAYQFGLQNQEIANLKNMINSVEQHQKFSSKVTQFGAGNVALPTQTANQG